MEKIVIIYLLFNCVLDCVLVTIFTLFIYVKKLILCVGNYIFNDYRELNNINTNCVHYRLLICIENIENFLSGCSMSSATDPNMTVLATTTDGRSVNHDFDNISIESNNINSLTLQNIREQMALSLERTKQLEIQVKLIPGLEVC